MQIAIETAEIKPYVAVVGYNCRKEITRCLDPWVNHVEGFILGDGKFDYYPGNSDYSTDGWLDYAYDRYKARADVQLYKYAGNQIEKRQRYLDIAGELKCDYLIVLDTDDFVDPNYTDFNRFYRQLILLSKVCTDRIFWMWEWIPSPDEWPLQGNAFIPNNWRRSARIHRDPGSMRYCGNCHYLWCSKDTTDEQIYEWQRKKKEFDNRLGMSLLDKYFELDNPFLFYSRNVIEGVRLKMDRNLRSKEQIDAGAEWAFLNGHEEKFREYCCINNVLKIPPPKGYESWDAYRTVKHSFNKETGKIILD